METDGRLLLTRAANRYAPAPYSVAVSAGPSGSRLVFQDDGNVVLYGPRDEVADDTGTAGSAAQRLVLQDDGNLVLYTAGTGVVFTFRTSEPSELRPGGSLLPGERLTSDDGSTSLVMQDDGNLVLYTRGVARFATGTSSPGAGLAFQTDGNAVVYSGSGQPLFSTGTGGPYDDLRLYVFDREVAMTDFVGDAPPTLFSSAWGEPVLESGKALYPGDRRTAPGGVLLVLQRDGNLVQYRGGRAVFATGTGDGVFAQMQPDGNLVLYAYDYSGDDPDGLVPVFSTRTAGNPGSRLVTQADGNLVVYTPAGRAVFSALR